MVPLMIAGNKLDLERDVDRDEAMEFAKEIEVPYEETSAWTGQNVKETFNKLFEEVYKKSKEEFDKKIAQIEKEKEEGIVKKKENESFKLDRDRHSEVERDEDGNKIKKDKRCCVIF